MATSYNLVDVVANPFWTGLPAVWDFWTIVMGNREQKVKAVTQWLPVPGAFYGVTQNKPEYQRTTQTWVSNQIAQQKKTQEGAKEFWGENVLLTTNITTPGMPTLPSLDEFLKYLPLIIIAIVAIFLLPKLFKGDKD